MCCGRHFVVQLVLKQRESHSASVNRIINVEVLSAKLVMENSCETVFSSITTLGTKKSCYPGSDIALTSLL